MTPEPISGFALSSVCHQTLTGGRSWITDAKVSDLGAPSCLHLGHIDTRMRRNAHSSTRRMPCVITVISQEPGRRLFLTNRRASRKRVWSVLNDSIRTYVWAILGAQAQTRSNILKTGTGFDAQRRFLANIEDAIASPVDIPCSIARYQKTLQYASTPLDFVFGIGLYLSPRDMALHPGNIQGYNNEIQIAGSDAAIGHYPGINEAEPVGSKGDKAFQGKIALPAVHKGPQPSQNKTRDSAADNGGTSAEERLSATAHEEEKTALVVIGIAGGLAALWLSSR